MSTDIMLVESVYGKREDEQAENQIRDNRVQTVHVREVDKTDTREKFSRHTTANYGTQLGDHHTSMMMLWCHQGALKGESLVVARATAPYSSSSPYPILLFPLPLNQHIYSTYILRSKVRPSRGCAVCEVGVGAAVADQRSLARIP